MFQKLDQNVFAKVSVEKVLMFERFYLKCNYLVQ